MISINTHAIKPWDSVMEKTVRLKKDGTSWGKPPGKKTDIVKIIFSSLSL